MSDDLVTPVYTGNVMRITCLHNGRYYSIVQALVGLCYRVVDGAKLWGWG